MLHQTDVSMNHQGAAPDKNMHKRPPIQHTLLGALSFSGRRITFYLLVLGSIIFFTFLALDLASGAPLTQAMLSALESSEAYLVKLISGSLGNSTAASSSVRPRPIVEVLPELFARSLSLLTLSLCLASVVGVFLGIWAAHNKKNRSLGVLLITTLGVSIPSFFAAFLLQWALITIARLTGRSLLPLGGFGWDKRLILPVLVLSARPIAQITRVTYGAVRETRAKDYVRTARSKGLRRATILSVHIMRNAAIPILTTIGVSLRFVLSSLPVVELYFGWVGVGSILLKAIAERDDILTVTLLLWLGIFFILINLALEISYRFIDPRLWNTPAHLQQSRPISLRNQFVDLWANLVDWFNQNVFFNWLRKIEGEKLQPLPLTQAKTEDDTLFKPRSFWRAAGKNIPFLVGTLIVFILVITVLWGPSAAPHDPHHTEGLLTVDGTLTFPPFAPGELFPWGTDHMGRDIMSLVLVGAGQTLALATIAVLARMFVGVTLGMLAGWYSGSRLDRLIIGANDIIAAFPTLLLTMLVILAVGIRSGMRAFIIALCVVGWGEIMQFVRSQAIGIRPQAYIESAISAGATTQRVITHHVLPNLLPMLISLVALEMGAVLMLLGELGFISIFIGGGTLIELSWKVTTLYSDVPEWGALLSNVRYLARSYPWTAFYPMLAFFVAIFGFNLFGEGVRRLVEQGHLGFINLVNRYTLVAVIILFFTGNWLSNNSGAMPFYRQHAETFDGSRALQIAEMLSSSELNGRALGSPGMAQAAQLIATEFATQGLQAGGEKNSFFQNRYHAFEWLEHIPQFLVHDSGSAPVYGKEYTAYSGYYASIGQCNGSIRVVGLGPLSPEKAAIWSSRYPTLDRADFSGEILLAFSDRDAQLLSGISKCGLLVVTDDSTRIGQRTTLSGRAFSEEDELGVPSLLISEDMAKRLLHGADLNLESLQQRITTLDEEEVFELALDTNVSMNIEGSIEERWPVQHVIGYLPGTYDVEFCADCLSRELIVVMAPYDNPPIGPETGLFAGANDNASGVAVMLEAMRVIQESDYEPFRSFLFVAYSGEGQDGGELVFNPDVARMLKAKTGFDVFEPEAIVVIRGVGKGTSRHLEVAADGSLRLAQLAEKSADQMGTKIVQINEAIDITIIYDGDTGSERGQAAPTVRLFGEGWQETSRTTADTVDSLDETKMTNAGRVLTMMLMILGREESY